MCSSTAWHRIELHPATPVNSITPLNHRRYHRTHNVIKITLSIWSYNSIFNFIANLLSNPSNKQKKHIFTSSNYYVSLIQQIFISKTTFSKKMTPFWNIPYIFKKHDPFLKYWAAFETFTFKMTPFWNFPFFLLKMLRLLLL